MPPKPSNTLTEAELRLMDILWSRGPSSVQQVVEAVNQERVLAYNSVLTTIRILERKGFVAHGKDGRAFVYMATIQRADAARTEVGHLVRRLFQNSHERLVLNLLEETELSQDTLEQLKRYLKERE